MNTTQRRVVATLSRMAEREILLFQIRTVKFRQPPLSPLWSHAPALAAPQVTMSFCKYNSPSVLASRFVAKLCREVSRSLGPS
jgi:hypothetical protein